MPDRNQRTPKNVPGKFYVDCQCLTHAMCQHLAPRNFSYDAADGSYYVCKQPETPEELAQCMEAVAACPMAAIGTDGVSHDA
jgi:ferredoxin